MGARRKEKWRLQIHLQEFVSASAAKNAPEKKFMISRGKKQANKLNVHLE